MFSERAPGRRRRPSRRPRDLKVLALLDEPLCTFGDLDGLHAHAVQREAGEDVSGHTQADRLVRDGRGVRQRRVEVVPAELGRGHLHGLHEPLYGHDAEQLRHRVGHALAREVARLARLAAGVAEGVVAFEQRAAALTERLLEDVAGHDPVRHFALHVAVGLLRLDAEAAPALRLVACSGQLELVR